MTTRNYRTGYVQEVPIEKIEPPDDALSVSYVAEIEQSMRKDGWQGRPLLVIDLGKKGMVKAITGSHRHEAALCAGLKSVPCYFVDILRVHREVARGLTPETRRGLTKVKQVVHILDRVADDYLNMTNTLNFAEDYEASALAFQDSVWRDQDLKPWLSATREAIEAYTTNHGTVLFFSNVIGECVDRPLLELSYDMPTLLGQLARRPVAVRLATDLQMRHILHAVREGKRAEVKISRTWDRVDVTTPEGLFVSSQGERRPE